MIHVDAMQKHGGRYTCRIWSDEGLGNLREFLISLNVPSSLLHKHYRHVFANVDYFFVPRFVRQSALQHGAQYTNFESYTQEHDSRQLRLL